MMMNRFTIENNLNMKSSIFIIIVCLTNILFLSCKDESRENELLPEPWEGNWLLLEVDEDNMSASGVSFEITNHVVDTVLMPTRYFSTPHVLPIHDTVTQFGKYQIGFITTTLHLDWEELFTNIEFREDGDVILTYDYVADGKEAEKTLPGQVRYKVENGKLHLSIPDLFENDITFNIEADGNHLKIYTDDTVLDTYMALKFLIEEYILKKNFVVRYMTEESIRHFMDVELYNLIQTSEEFKFGLNFVRNFVQ